MQSEEEEEVFEFGDETDNRRELPNGTEPTEGRAAETVAPTSASAAELLQGSVTDELRSAIQVRRD